MRKPTQTKTNATKTDTRAHAHNTHKKRALPHAGGERIAASAVVLAPGHSARGLYEALAARGVPMAAKPFALGFRIEHEQVIMMMVMIMVMLMMWDV